MLSDDLGQVLLLGHVAQVEHDALSLVENDLVPLESHELPFLSLLLRRAILFVHWYDLKSLAEDVVRVPVLNGAVEAQRVLRLLVDEAGLFDERFEFMLCLHANNFEK